MQDYEKVFDGKIHEVRIYDSVSEAISETGRAESEWPHLASEMQGKCVRAGFVGRAFANMAEARVAADAIWPAGLKVMERFTNDLAGADLPKPVSRKRKMKWDESTGDEIDNDRLRGGQDFWRRATRQQLHGPSVITLVAVQSASASVDAKDILWRGAAAVALTKILEEAGYRVDLWGAMVSRGSFADNTSLLIGTHLKQPNEPINESALVNACSGWFYRTIGFSSYLASPKRRASDYGLGTPFYPKPELLREISSDASAHLLTGVFNYEDTLARAREILAAIGTPNHASELQESCV